MADPRDFRETARRFFELLNRNNWTTQTAEVALANELARTWADGYIRCVAEHGTTGVADKESSRG